MKILGPPTKSLGHHWKYLVSSIKIWRSPMKIGGLRQTFWESWGFSNVNLRVSNEYLGGLPAKILGIFNENLGVSNYNFRVTNENMGSPMKRLGSPMKIRGSLKKICGLKENLQWIYLVLLEKIRGSATKIWGLNLKLGVANDNLRVSNEKYGLSDKMAKIFGFYKAETDYSPDSRFL